MLPLSYHQVYENLYSHLHEFSGFLASADFPIDNTDFNTLRSIFASRVVHLTGDELSDIESNQWRPVQTELYRAWRLLETDWVFLTSARAGTVRERRLKTVRDRVAQMMGYCEYLLKSEDARE